jgi:hypothetical protein
MLRSDRERPACSTADPAVRAIEIDARDCRSREMASQRAAPTYPAEYFAAAPVDRRR